MVTYAATAVRTFGYALAGVTGHRVRIEVADDGHGFPFEGEYDLPALIGSDLGPASLRDRIASLGGSLSLRSSRQGSRLEIGVPLETGRA